jgi:hypothetical protein
LGACRARLAKELAMARTLTNAAILPHAALRADGARVSRT